MGLLVVAGEGCDPDQSVKAGAPELTKLTILEPTPNGPSPTDITAETPMCATGVKPGGVCWLMDEPAPPDGGTDDDASAPDAATDAATGDGGVTDAAQGDASNGDGSSDGVSTTAVTTGLAKADPGVCLLNAADWCRCQVDPDLEEGSPKGKWNCDPFVPSTTVIATFDRLIDTTPFEADAGIAPSEIVTLTATPAPPLPYGPALDYSSTGSLTSIVFINYSPFFGNFRAYGPSLLIGGAPAMPATATISIDLSKANIRAKDGKTPFLGAGFLIDGSLKYKTGTFEFNGITPPAPESETDPLVISFNNQVGEDVLTHIKVTADGAPFTAFASKDDEDEVDQNNAPFFPMTDVVLKLKKGVKWDPTKTYTVTVDATTVDAVGDKIGTAPAPATFSTAPTAAN